MGKVALGFGAAEVVKKTGISAALLNIFYISYQLTHTPKVVLIEENYQSLIITLSSIRV